MGKNSTYCQISGCSPEVVDLFDWEYDYNLSEYELEDASESERIGYQRVREAFDLLLTEDESEGTQPLSIIGPYDYDNKPIWEFEENPNNLYDLLEEAEGLVRDISHCSMGGMWDCGYCGGPTGDSDGAIVTYGAYFFVQTVMLPILAGATQDRVPVQRLWKLAMMKGHYKNHGCYVLPGVDYGPICDCQGADSMWLFGDADRDEVLNMGDIGTAEDIAEVLRKRGFWMWMRPDRFPIEPNTALQAFISNTKEYLAESHEAISTLPLEIIHSIMLGLDTWDIVALASTNKRLYYQILGDKEARDSLAKAHIHKHARWCLPYGETELKWWTARKGDDVLGWDYLRRCWSESHSMRNRRRIWRAAESIEAECDRMEAECKIELPW